MGLYGGHVESFWIDGRKVGRRLGALVGLLRRQEALKYLCIIDESLFPLAAEAVAAGAGQRLEVIIQHHLSEDYLSLEEISDPACAVSFISLLQGPQELLPALHRLEFRGMWHSVPDVFERLLDCLARGALPRLKSLRLDLDEDDEIDRERLAPLAAALAARQALGCPGLTRLELHTYNWVKNGPLEARRALWEVLLPTITEPLPTLESTGNDAWRVLVDVIMQHGAPYLPRMDFEEPYALRCLPHLTAMTELVLRDVSFDVAVVLEEVIENAAAGGPPVFPALEELNVYYDGKEGGDWFFRALGRADAPRLTKLRIGFLRSIDEVFETTAVAVGEIMAAGAFPSLQDLRFLDMGDDELAMIMPGLAAGACAHTLQTLEIFYG